MQGLDAAAVFKLALPYDNHVPAEVGEFLKVLGIPLDIPFDLQLPKIRVGLRNLVFLAVLMPVPETTVYHYHGVEFFQYDVGFARHSLLMQSETVSFRMQVLPDDEFGFRVLRPDAAHDLAPALRCEHVGHIQTLHTPVPINIPITRPTVMPMMNAFTTVHCSLMI
jgi:hypothetical protein